MIVITHSGIDCGYRDKEVKCPPVLVRKVIDSVGHDKFVLAHFGGNEMVGDVLSYLAGQKVYLDTALISKFIKKEEFLAVLDKHGEDRILFASDFPWGDFDSDANLIKSYGLNAQTEEKIFYKNASRLLCLND